MQPLLLFMVCSLLTPSLVAADPPQPLADVSLGRAFLDDGTIRSLFADLLRLGGYGRWSTERAAFLVRDPEAGYRCMLWPATRELNRERFVGAVPAGTVAIVHTHPEQTPRASPGDEQLARRLRLPVVILTSNHVYVASPGGEITEAIKTRMWAASVAPGRTCEPAALPH